jgi:hypothetical protein
MPGPLIHTGLSQPLDCSPSPTPSSAHCLPFGVFTIHLHLLPRDLWGETKSRETEMISLCYQLAPIKCLNNWPNLGIQSVLLFLFLKSLGRRGLGSYLYTQTSWWTWEIREHRKQARAAKRFQNPICKVRKGSRHYGGDSLSTGCLLQKEPGLKWD